MATYRVRLTFPSESVVWKVPDAFELLGATGGHSVQSTPFVVVAITEAKGPEDAVQTYEHLVHRFWPDDSVGVEIEPRRFRVGVAGPIPLGSGPEAIEIVARLDTNAFLVNSSTWAPGSDGSMWATLVALDETDARRQADAIASRLPGWTVSGVSPAD